jgi:hypothetical protein
MNMKNTRERNSAGRRIFSLLMAAVMVLGMLPVTGTVMAAAGTTTYADPQTLTCPTDIYGDTTLNTGKVTGGDPDPRTQKAQGISEQKRAPLAGALKCCAKRRQFEGLCLFL